MLGSGENEGMGRMNMISSLPLQVQPSASEMQSTSVSLKKDDRVPQWTHQEAKDFIAIRAELERDFTVTKRNKTLWGIVAARMKKKGYRRSPDQCKCKWKNLVNRYKGKETSDPENGRQCPFFEEIHAVFVEREKNMQRLLLESEVGNVQGKKKVKKLSGGDRSSDDFSEDDEEDEDESEEERATTSGNRRKRKADREKHQQQQQRTERSSVRVNGGSIQEMLQEFFNQLQRMDMQWRETMERRAQERRLIEQEWRKSMEKLERERLMMEQAWREREEQRRMKEERRLEERDALLTSLLNKLLNENL
ncbi:trihelix transcription factor GT-3b-like [Macadamia integrifolia]|uniref:trihelix transcription factor GT-3b-like n=1 Tax=Macadamia integrifolia TaxID=60698 RepID=UPI001C4F1F6E|nr:trihelix transcription factor GT-3b-like [Macadamia integrifolia]